MPSRNPSVRAFVAAMPVDVRGWSVIAHPEVTYVLYRDPALFANFDRVNLPPPQHQMMGVLYTETATGTEPNEWRLYHDGTLRARGFVYDGA